MNTTTKEKTGTAFGNDAAAEWVTPEVDVIETAAAYTLHLDVPGATLDGLDVQFERGELTIRAAAKAPATPPRWLLREYRTGDYTRRFTIGEGIDANRIEATLKNGVLTVTLPKSDEIRARKIAVKSQ